MSPERTDRPQVFSLCDREWDLLDELFAPAFSPSTALAVDFLDLAGPHSAPRGGSFLEVGCGAGVVAVMAALAGYDRVVASDIIPRAVENAAVNAERHEVQDRLSALHSDLFSGLSDGDRFDVIFWSSNYVRAPEDHRYRSVQESASADSDRAHRRYLEQAPHWLTPEGSALLHLSDRGDVPALYRIAEECGRELSVLRSHRVREGQYGDAMVEHLLVRILPVRT
ncbi:50S ribosomal protein L11 methyltransferase [Streptomyces sp. NPDC051211]|uniref:50S ribosomal protein L11 methyltransferase n=1 Tax=Streptomyces sp. NPDC051211 TaxID=3154643 RepID=UPI00344DC0CB